MSLEMPGGSVYPLPPPPPLGKDRVKLQFNLGNARQLFPVAKRLAHIMQMSETSNVCRKLLIMLEEQRGLLSGWGSAAGDPLGITEIRSRPLPCLFLGFSGILASGLVLTPGPFLPSVSSHTPASILPGQCTLTPISTPTSSFPSGTAFSCLVSLCLFSDLLCCLTELSWPRQIREAATAGRGRSPTPRFPPTPITWKWKWT